VRKFGLIEGYAVELSRFCTFQRRKVGFRAFQIDTLTFNLGNNKATLNSLLTLHSNVVA